MTRKDARTLLMQVVFQMEANNTFDVNKEEEYIGKSFRTNQKEYCKEVFSLLINKKEEIDKAISEASTRWSISRMAKVELAILRLAVCEMLYVDAINNITSINEAVKLAADYGDGNKSAVFVNGVLAAVNEACTSTN